MTDTSVEIFYNGVSNAVLDLIGPEPNLAITSKDISLLIRGEEKVLMPFLVSEKRRTVFITHDSLFS